jgi:hypothetical protein
MADAVLIALIAAISGGAAAALITGAFQRPKTRAEAQKLVQESGTELDSRWKQWADNLERRLLELERRLTEKDAELAALSVALERERWVTRLVIAWAFTMRDEIVRLAGIVIDPPAEVQDYIDEMNVPPNG